MNNKKLYESTVKEINGEQEYTHSFLLYAVDVEEAEKIADAYTKSFYEDDDVEKDGDFYLFFDGGIACRIESVKGVNKYEWLAQQFRFALITEAQDTPFRAVLNIQGGVVQEILSDIPLDVLMLDYDTDGVEPEKLTTFDGQDVMKTIEDSTFDPETVRQLFDL